MRRPPVIAVAALTALVAAAPAAAAEHRDVGEVTASRAPPYRRVAYVRCHPETTVGNYTGRGDRIGPLSWSGDWGGYAEEPDVRAAGHDRLAVDRSGVPRRRRLRVWQRPARRTRAQRRRPHPRLPATDVVLQRRPGGQGRDLRADGAAPAGQLARPAAHGLDQHGRELPAGLGAPGTRG